MNLGKWTRRRAHLKVFLFLALAAILFNGAETFVQFKDEWFKRRYYFKIFLFLALAANSISRGTICAIFDRGHYGNIGEKLF